MLALELMASDALRAPRADGPKVTVTVHVAPMARGDPVLHVPPRTKSAPWVPDTAIELKVSAAVPLFSTVTLC